MTNFRTHRVDDRTAVGTMPPPTPPPSPSPLITGVDVISTMVHSRPLARKTRLVIGLMYLESATSENDDDEEEEDE